ncbi:MAG: PEP-CTERM sorting domain-containing protein [Lentisphaerae bacterium]|nr:PEP-CTERM sorting domain-containing protein [Lentisphaerota bacterium]
MKTRLLDLGLAAVFLSCQVSMAVDNMWDGGGANANWATAGNWTNDVAPTFGNTLDIHFFAPGTSSNRTTYLGGAGRTVRSITFNDSADSNVNVRLDGNNAAAQNLTFDTDAVGGNAAITVTSGAEGSFNIGSTARGTIILADNLLVTHDGTGDLTLGRVMQGAFSVTKNGTGNLILSGTNTFTGGLVLNAGTLTLGNYVALGGAANVFTINGGTIDANAALTMANNNQQNWNGDFTFGGANTLDLGTGAVTLGGNRIVTVAGSTLTVGGAIGDGGANRSLTKLGTGTLLLSGANTYGGNTTIQTGTLTIASTGALPGWNTAGRFAVQNGAALAVFNAVGDAAIDTLLGTGNFAAGSSLGFDTSSGHRSYGNVLSNFTGGTMGLLKLGGNTLILSGANSYGGGTTIAGGLLNVTNDTALGAGGGGLTFNGGALQTSGDMTLNNRTITLTGAATNIVDAGTTLTLTNSISGAGAWVKAGAGTMVLAGTATFGAAPLFNEGAVNLLGTFSSGANNLSIGRVAGTPATVNVQGGTVTGAVFMAGAASGSTGLVYQTGGTVTMGTSAQAGGATGAYGEYHLYGGTLDAGPNLYIAVNAGTAGLFEITNGILTATTLRVGRDGNAAGTNQFAYYYQTGGTSTVGTLTVAGGGAALGTIRGTFAVTSGTFSATSFNALAGVHSSTGRLYFGSGALVTLGAFPTTRGANSYADLTIDGGSLTPSAASTAYMSALDHAYLTTNGAIFNVPTARNITVLQPLEDYPGQLGTLTKTGVGVLTLSGTNVYGGFTDIRAGALAIATTNALPGLYAAGRYVVSNGAALAVGNAVADADVAAILGTGNLAAGAAIGFDTTAGGREYALALADTGAGALGLLKLGANTLILSGANSYSGGTLVTTGMLVVANNSALGSTAAGTTVLDGGQLILSNGVVVTGESLDIAGSGVGFTGAVQAAASSSGTWAGPVTLGANARLGAGVGGTLTISGNIQNGAAADLLLGPGIGGVGTVILSGTNGYTGATRIARGILRLGADDTLPTGTTLDVDSANAAENAIFDLSGFNQTVGELTRTSTGGGAGASIVTNTSATLSTLTVNPAITGTYSGVIGNNIAFVKNGSGTQTLSGANTYTGTTTIAGGVLAFSRTANFTNASSHIGGAGVLANAGSAAMVLLGSNSYSGGTLLSGTGRIAIGDDSALGTGTVTFAGNGSQLSSVGTAARVLANNLAINTNITLGHGTDSGLLTFNGDVDLGGNNSRRVFVSSDAVINGIVANGGLIKTGAATLTLSGPNTYAGGTSVGQGRLQLGGDNVLGSGPLTLSGGGLMSSSTDARTLTNAIRITANAVLGDAVNNGRLTLSGPIDLAGAPRSVSNYSAVVLSGGSSNGVINKYGPETMVVQGVHRWPGVDSAMFDGTVIVDGGTITNDAVIFRASASLPNGQARLVITNGGSIVMTGTARNFRAGYTAGDGTQTNILDIAGIVRMPDASAAHGRLILGTDSALGVANLLAGGDLQMRHARAADQGIVGASVLNFNGGVLRALANEADFIRTLTAANVQAGGAIFETAGFNVTVAQPLVNGGGGGGLTKQGAGRLTLTGTNTYTGTTRVMAGVLEIAGDGSVDNSTTLQIDALATMLVSNRTASTLNLKSGQTLKGHGTFVGGMIMEAGSTNAPGTSAGILTIDGGQAVTMQTQSVYAVELKNTGEFDKLVFAGGSTLTLGGADLLVTLLPGYSLAVSNTFKIVDGLPTAATGTFKDKPNDSTFVVESTTLKINYNPNDITLTVVPEPGTLGLLGALAAAGWLLRRRVRKA